MDKIGFILVGVSVVVVGIVLAFLIPEPMPTTTPVMYLTEEEMNNRPLMKREEKEVEEEVELIIDEIKREPLSIGLDADLQDKVFEYAEMMSVDPYLFLALMESESATFDPEAKGDWREDGYGNKYYTSYGMTQIHDCWWDKFESYGLDIFNNPCDQIIGGMLILKAYETETTTQTLMNYKCGVNRAKQLIEQGVVLQVVTDIIERSEELRKEGERCTN